MNLFILRATYQIFLQFIRMIIVEFSQTAIAKLFSPCGIDSYIFLKDVSSSDNFRNIHLSAETPAGKGFAERLKLLTENTA